MGDWEHAEEAELLHELIDCLRELSKNVKSLVEAVTEMNNDGTEKTDPPSGGA